MSATASEELDERLALVREVAARAADPLDAPLAIHFRPTSGAAVLAEWQSHARAVEKNDAPEEAVLYAHVPFCARICTYCLLSSSTSPGKAPTEAYVRALLRQIETFEPVVRALKFRTLHVGGGTPTILSEAQLDALFDRLARFRRTDDFQIGVEAHPATATPSKIEVLRAHGVTRVSFGVETMTDDVLRAVHRGDQTRSRVIAAVETVRKAGLDVNLDLLAGLPGETVESFEASVRAALALEPDSMSVNRFLLENAPLGDEGQAHDASHERSMDAMLVRADEVIRTVRPPRWPDRPLDAPGFGTQYVWDRSRRARAYFQQDMIGAASTLGFGHGALSHLHGRFFSIGAGSVDEWVASIERGEPAPTISATLTPRFELAFELADRACRGRASLRDLSRTFRADVRRVLGPEIDHLVTRGVLHLDGDVVSKPPDRSFQVTHLLAYLLSSAGELRAMLRSLPTTASRSAALRQYDDVGAELPPVAPLVPHRDSCGNFRPICARTAARRQNVTEGALPL